MEDFKILESNRVVCPFRTYIKIGQQLNENNVPEQYQLTVFPECQYSQCPFYNSDGKNASEKCFKCIN